MTENFEALRQLAPSRWTGQNELWLDPEGNQALSSEGTIEVQSSAVLYTWSYEGQTKQGRIDFGPDGVSWSDTWHQPKSMACRPFEVPGALLAVQGSYAAPPGPDWGWRIGMAQRPSGERVLQMTNVASRGEEGRAVRLVTTKA